MDQIKALLGHSTPEDLQSCHKFMTISFRYFAASLRLFHSSIWLDALECQSRLLSKFSGTLDQIAPLILFNSNQGFYDNPEKIRKLYSQCCPKMEADAAEIALKYLQTMVQIYAQGSNIGLNCEEFQETTQVSMTVMPSPNFELVSTFLLDQKQKRQRQLILFDLARPRGFVYKTNAFWRKNSKLTITTIAGRRSLLDGKTVEDLQQEKQIRSQRGH